MSIVYKLDGVTLDPENVYLHWGDEEGFEGSQAADGTGAFGSVTFHDPDGTLNVRGWMPFTIDETDCTTAPRLVTAWIWIREYAMGEDELAPAARTITCQLLDPNALLSLRLITGASANRPSETDTARIAWLLASDSMTGLVSDTGYVNTTGQTMDAQLYRGVYPSDGPLSDVCAGRDMIFFAFYDQVAEAISLFLDSSTATTLTSSLTISNVPGDLSSTCFPPFDDAKLERDPSLVYGSIRFVYTGGVVYRRNETIISTYFPAPLSLRSFQVENMRVGKATTATILADRILAANSTERDEITLTIRVPSTQVGLIDAGMRVGVRNTRWANEGYGSLTYTRVERRTFKQAEGRRSFYDVTLTLSNHGIFGAGGTGGGSTDPFPYNPPPATASIVQQVSGYNTFVMPSGNVTGGDTLVFVGTSRDVIPWNYSVFGYTLASEQAMGSGSNRAFCVYKLADGTEGDTLATSYDEVSGTWYELPGGWTPDTSDTSIGAGSPVTAGPITVAANSIAFTASAYGQGGAYDSQAATDLTTPGSGWTEDYDSYTRAGGAPTAWTAHQFPSAGSLSMSSSNSAAGGAADGFGVNTTNWGAVLVSFTGDVTSPDPPGPGKPWGPVLPNETPDGSTTSFTMPTGYTWAEGSLRVFVQHLDQTLAVTAEDGAAGTFTLGFAPKTGWLVEVYGVGL